MIAWAIIDTGPLVAYLEARENAHAWIRELLDEVVLPLHTCEPVLTEALFILRRHGRDHRALFSMLERGAVQVDYAMTRETMMLNEMMSDYADLPMSLADACLVRMAELHPRAEIITLDRHFKMYRTRDRRVLKLCLPPLEKRR